MLEYQITKRPILIIISAFICFLPALLIFTYHIWPPTAMVHEVFGTYYFRYTFSDAHFIAETGHGSLASLAYTSSILSNLFFLKADLFTKMLAFSYFFYTFSGALLFAIYVCLIRAGVRAFDILGLLIVPITTTLLERETNLGLMINYDRSQAIILVAVGALILWQRIEGYRVKNIGIFAGILAGYTVAVKFTNLFIIVPFIVSSLLTNQRGLEQYRRPAATMLWWFIGSFLLAMILYSKFSLSTLINIPSWIWNLYHGPWIEQRTPFLNSELTHFDGSSYYTPLQIAFILLLIVYPFTVIAAIRHRSIPGIGQCTAIFISLSTLLAIFSHRAAQGTMIDISFITLFSLYLCTSFLLVSKSRIYSSVATGVFLAFSGFAFIFQQPGKILDDLAINSRNAEQFNLYTKAHKNFPMVYYMDGLSQPVLMPSPEQICAYKASAAANYTSLLAKNCPRTQIRGSNAGLLNEAHYAIFPEYIDTLPETDQMNREWPEHWKEIKLLQNNNWQRVLAPYNCKVFNFVATQAPQHLVYFSSYPLKATVCLIMPSKTDKKNIL